MNREDMVGRIMAHAFQDELEKISGADAVAYKLIAPLRRAHMNARTPLELLSTEKDVSRMIQSAQSRGVADPSNTFVEALHKSIDLDNAPGGARELRRRANQLSIKQR